MNNATTTDSMQKRNVEGRRGPDGGQLQLPPGFRFYPSDEELVVHYLCKRAASQPFSVPIIAEVDLYKFDPWELPEKALFGEKEWYFFSPRDRKYPNGSRPNRAAGSGYWKATGTDKPISMHHGGGGQKVGVKKALVFYKGRPPKGDKTNWIMHEYRLADSAAKAARRKGSVRLDDWVLCRIYKKLPSATRLAMQKEEGTSEEVTGFDAAQEDTPEMEESSKNVANLSWLSPPPSKNIANSSWPSSTTTTTMMGIQAPSYTNYNNVTNNYTQQQPHMSSPLHMSSHLQMAPTLLGGNLNKPFIKPPHTYEGMIKPSTSSHEAGMAPSIYKPSMTSHDSLMGNQGTSLSQAGGRTFLTIPNLTLGNHDHSPVHSSVDEERGLPAERSQANANGNLQHLANSSGNLPHLANSSGDLAPIFTFDSLPSPFGRLESFQHFPF
eukprot:c9086_g1_i1 orf=131-1444(+)